MTRTKRHRHTGRQYVMTIEVCRGNDPNVSHRSYWEAVAVDLPGAAKAQFYDKSDAIQGAKANGFTALGTWCYPRVHARDAQGPNFDAVIVVVKEV